MTTNKTDTEEKRQNNKNMDNKNTPERGSSSFAAKQLKISSLLTISSNEDSKTLHINDTNGNKIVMPPVIIFHRLMQNSIQREIALNH